MTRKCHQPQTEPVASARGGGQQRGSEKIPMTPFSTEVPAGGRAPLQITQGILAGVRTWILVLILVPRVKAEVTP